MKAFLLAAGFGTRLSPLTDSMPKCLLPINGRPMLDIWLQLLRRHGVGEVLINLHAHAEVVRAHIAAHPPAVRVRLEEERVLLGSAGTLRRHQAWARAESAVWVCYADVLTNCQLDRLWRHHQQEGQMATMGLYAVPDPQRCGIAEMRNGRIVSFHEKPANPTSNLAFAGIMLLNPKAIALIPERTPADIGYDLLPQLVGRMTGMEIGDFVMDIGTKSNYDRAQRAWLDLTRASAS